MKLKEEPLLKVTKETQKERKKRVSSGIKFRPSVFPNKKKRDVPKGHDENNESDL